MKKKILSLFVVLAITIFEFIPMASALNYDLEYDVDNHTKGFNSYNITSNVVTLYVGNISVNGESRLKYLYTDKSVGTDALNEIDKILTSDYRGILPKTAGQIKVSNDNSVSINDAFTDAGMAAVNMYPTGTVSDTSSTILYSTTDYNNLTFASSKEISDEATAEANNLSSWSARKANWEEDEQNKSAEDPEYSPVDFPEEYIKSFNDSTVYPADPYFLAEQVSESDPFIDYIIRNGVVTQYKSYNINRTIIKVVNTSADVTIDESSKTQINGADVTLTAPKVGDKVEKVKKTLNGIEYDTQSLNPTVTTTTKGISVYAYWVSGLEDLSEEPFYGTFEEDKYYYAMIDFEAEEGYELPATFPDGINVNGVKPDEIFAVYGGVYTHCIVKIKASSVLPTYDFTEGSNQKYVLNEDDTATFRINADYSLFENGGKVFVDDNLVSKDNYTSKSGSTIIAFTKAYMNTLSTGNHTLKVVFNNGGTAESTFTIAEKDTNNPKTGDNIMQYILVLGLSIIAISTVGIYLRKKRFN